MESYLSGEKTFVKHQ
ncbi:DUF5951 family protein, partial [Klebsiella pneumoniae]